MNEGVTVDWPFGKGRVQHWRERRCECGCKTIQEPVGPTHSVEGQKDCEWCARFVRVGGDER